MIPENVFSLDLCMEGEPGQRQVLYAPLGVYYFALESGFTNTQLRCTTSPTLLLWGLTLSTLYIFEMVNCGNLMDATTGTICEGGQSCFTKSHTSVCEPIFFQSSA